jgi:hypothetical protein
MGKIIFNVTASLTKFGTGTKLRTGHCPEEHQQVTLLQTEEWNPQVMSRMTLLQTEERNVASTMILSHQHYPKPQNPTCSKRQNMWAKQNR